MAVRQKKVSPLERPTRNRCNEMKAVVGEQGTPGASGGRVAHHGRLLEADADAAARGVFDRLFGVAGEAVHLETVHEEQSGYGERASLSTGADKKANTRGQRRT